MDMRKILLENLIIIRGTTMAEGLLLRLKDEISTLLKTDVYKEKLHSNIAEIRRVPAFSAPFVI